MKTTINGMEFAIYGRKEIAMAFTEKVNEYLMNGFHFYIGEEGRGHQGEETKVCLTKGDEKIVYVIFLDNRYNGYDLPNTMELCVKKYENSGRTFWLEKEGEEIEKKVFYAIERRCCGRNQERFVESLADFKVIKAIQDERWGLKYSYEKDIVLPEKYKKLALKVLQNKKGHKSRQLKNVIKVVKRSSCQGKRWSYAIHMSDVGFVNL